ncbi:hypothetical protein DUI87_00336 [Hirundo rustica rustica]|uniref:Uncharacterized protein n=1 Tax=Hirundo rustica rustica TaxID=333673 RepID=A0A3M0LI48_HIRRU|nr:hypothetical protein DUI87_00336 [Hirundo rustica rustica]
MPGGTKSSPVLVQRMVKDGESGTPQNGDDNDNNDDDDDDEDDNDDEDDDNDHDPLSTQFWCCGGTPNMTMTMMKVMTTMMTAVKMKMTMTTMK